MCSLSKNTFAHEPRGVFSFWKKWKWLEHECTSSVEGLSWLLGTWEALLSIHGIEGGGSRQPLSKDRTAGKSQGWLLCWNIFVFSLISCQQAEEKGLWHCCQFQCLPSLTGWRAAEAACTPLGWHQAPHKSSASILWDSSGATSTWMTPHLLFISQEKGGWDKGWEWTWNKDQWRGPGEHIGYQHSWKRRLLLQREHRGLAFSGHRGCISVKWAVHWWDLNSYEKKRIKSLTPFKKNL